MPFNGTFEQVFTFESKANGGSLGDLVIKVQNHPFISTAIENGNSIKISINGAEALAFTKAKSDRVESLKIRLNGDQSFQFTIKLTLPELTELETTQEVINNDTDVTKYEVTEANSNTRYNPIAQLYGWKLQNKEELEQSRREIQADLSFIEKNGEITIDYKPPIAIVPTDWDKYFSIKELSKLNITEREEREEKAKEFMHVTFVKNSEEQPQTYFVANLTQFKPEGIKINLNFSDPLFVSQGGISDHVKIKLLKSFFMNPKADDWQGLRDLASL